MVEVVASLTAQPDEAAMQGGCLKCSSMAADGRGCVKTLQVAHGKDLTQTWLVKLLVRPVPVENASADPPALPGNSSSSESISGGLF